MDRRALQAAVHGIARVGHDLMTKPPPPYSWHCYCSCLVTKSYLTLCDPMDCSLQAPLSMEFPRQEYCSGLQFPPPEDLPDPGIEPLSAALAGGFFTTEPPGKPGIHKISGPYFILSHLCWAWNVFLPPFHLRDSANTWRLKTWWGLLTETQFLLWSRKARVNPWHSTGQ